MSEAPQSFAEFWPMYLRAHRNPTSRLMHYIGTTGGLICLALLIVTGWWPWLVIGTVFAYAMAWSGHFFVEGNVPLAFSKPVWSLLADYRMFGLMLTGRLKHHLARAGAA